MNNEPTKADYKRLAEERLSTLLSTEKMLADSIKNVEEQRMLKEKWMLLVKELQENYNALLANYGHLQLEFEEFKKGKPPSNGGLTGFADV